MWKGDIFPLVKKSGESASRPVYEHPTRDPFDGLPIGLYRTLPTGQLLYANQALVEMLKYPDLETMKAESVTTAYIDPAARDRWRAILERDGSITNFENENRCYDGSIIWIRDNARAVRGPDGQTAYYEGAIEDVTARREIETRLLREHTYFTQLFESSPEGIVMVDPEDRVGMVNSEFTRMFGFRAEEAVGQKLDELIVPKGLEYDGAAYSRAVQSGISTTFESFRRTKDGRLIPVSVLAKPFSVPGEETSIYVIYRDITDRQEALNALQKSEDRFRSLIENSSELVAIFDMTGRRTYASPASARTLGYSQNELLTQDAFANIHPDDAELVSRTFAELAHEPGGVRSVECRYRRKDGEWRVFSIIGTNLITHPAVGGIVINSRDVTQQHMLEEQLRRSQKMEAVGRLAGGVAHDFNNLLTVISTYSDFILGDSALQSSHRDDLVEIKKASDRAATLTRQLLAVSRNQVLQPNLLNLNSLVEDLRHMLDRVLPANIEVRINARTDLWPVRADSGQIEQVLLNLALNARDAMPQGGILTFTTQNEVVGPTSTLFGQEYVIPPGEYVALSVADTGVGMDRTTERKIFEPFFTTKGTGKGTGLGLATVYGIVRQTGGYIDVQTEVGKGSSFRILLARAQGEVKSVSDQARPSVEHRTSATILLAEDERPVRDAVARILREEGYTVIAAANGIEAMGIWEAESKRIDILITDLLMPEMGGVELAQSCRRLNSSLPVLYMSGFTEATPFDSDILSEIASFLEKPFKKESFLDKVRQLLYSATLESGQ